MTRGDRSLIGNRGYRKSVKNVGRRFEIDEAKVEPEARFDGTWVLQTNAEMTAEETALK